MGLKTSMGSAVALMVIGTGFLPGADCLAGGMQFPADAGLVNVKTDFGAVGDGETDDTEAIQKAIDATKGKFRILYFPDGTYLVSKRLTYGFELADCKQNVIQGQSRDRTVLKLKDSADQFDSAAAPRPLLTFFEGNSTGQAFHNAVYDMTFDVGAGNPGAIGLRYIDNNQGGVFNVMIRSSDPKRTGAVGLDMSKQWPGPGLIQNVSIVGFDVGVDVGHYEYSMAFSNIELSGQHVVGIRNGNNILTIEGLKSTNACPAVVQAENLGQLTLVNCVLDGGKGGAAITTPGPIYLQGVKQSGYDLMVKNPPSGNAQMPAHAAGDLKADTVEAYSGHPAITLNGVSKPAILPIKLAPVIAWDEPADWIAVKGGSGTDDSPAIQAAIDQATKEGKSTVYFPGGHDEGYYTICKTVRVHGSVRRIIGCESNLKIGMPLLQSSEPVFRFEGLTSSAVVFERFWMTPWEDNVPFPIRCPVIEANDPKATIVLRNLMMTNNAFRTGPSGRGDVFVEDVTGRTWSLKNGQKMWARQFNPEGRKHDIPYVTCDNATFWCMDLKTEGRPTVISAKNHSHIALLGGLIYPINPGLGPDTPMFEILNSEATITTAEAGTVAANNYKIYVKGSENGRKFEIDRNQGISRGYGGFIPLFLTSDH